MDVTLIIGWVLGIFLIVNGIRLENIGNFIDPDSMIIVVGGTVAALIASFPFRILKQIPKHFLISISTKKYNAVKVIDTLVDMAGTARKNGLLVLEEKANEAKDPFLQQSIMLIVDAMDAEKIREMLEDQLAMMAERHDEEISFYEKGSAIAPAFGMIGTLVGLINMLKNMNLEGGAGGSNIGTDMSIALITTFYGCVLAHLLFSPLAKKLRIRNDEEMLYKQIIIEGVLAIQSGDNPKFLEEKLYSFLAMNQQKKAKKKKGGKQNAGAEPGEG